MSALDFVHLRVRSEYSIQDSLLKISTLIPAAQRNQMPAIALTDLCNLFGIVKFYRQALKAGIKPIIGAELWLTSESQQPIAKLVVLCIDQTGYQNLIHLISNSYLNPERETVPCVPKAWLQKYGAGLIVLSGGQQGDIGQALLSEQPEKAQQLLQQWMHCFPNRFYIELQQIGRPGESSYYSQALHLASQFNCPVVATNEALFLQASDYAAHETKVCIQQGTTLNQTQRNSGYLAQQYLKTAAEMTELFKAVPCALRNSVEIAKRCNVTLPLDQVFLPNFPVPKATTIAQYLEQAAKEGLALRWATQKPAEQAIYDARLKYELNVINEMGYPGYFLIVSDFIRWAKQQKIPVGPGRGSGAGSLVAYALQITDLDPIQYDLLFERFLNPDRVSMPDFDVDFCMEGRDRVIDYVANKYGRNSVAQIVTFGTMAAKAVIRDVGRALGHPYGFVDKIAKLIPFEIGITLEKALADEAALAQLYQDEAEVQELIDLAKKLEGLVRNVGKHAGGVVIAPTELTGFSAIYCEQGHSQALTQLDKDDVEAVGLVKFDFLGLRTLTIIDWAVQHVNELRAQAQSPPISITELPLDDAPSYALLKRCDTTAVFQLESRGMKELIQRLQPDDFEEIIALVALFRPGPLQSGMVDDFINCKHGRAQVQYPHPDLVPILKPTYGVILYQEQVMQIAQVLAGYTLGGADLLRRAMGKKNAQEMAKQRTIFTDGAMERGVDSKNATYIFDLMEKFAGYGFNKSHSAAYALVSYQTAWLKTHYPEAFMAAVLSADMAHTEKMVSLIEDCRHLKLLVIPPDVNLSQYKFTLNPEKNIVYGLGAIKGVGENAIYNIIQARQQYGGYRDLFDFCTKVALKKVNKRVLEALIKAGAMDSFGHERAALLASIEKALNHAEQQLRAQQQGQTDLFAQGSIPSSPMQLNKVKPWTETVRLKGEKDTLGFYLTGHPIHTVAHELEHFVTHSLQNLPKRDQTEVVLAGVLVAIRTLQTKRGDRMAFVTLDDGSAKIEIAIFSDLYLEQREQLIKDDFLVVSGLIHIDKEQQLRIRAKTLMSLAKARERYAKGLTLWFNQAEISTESLQQIKHLLQAHPGVCPLQINYQAPTVQAYYRAPQYSVLPSSTLLERLIELLGPTNVALEYKQR